MNPTLPNLTPELQTAAAALAEALAHTELVAAYLQAKTDLDENSAASQLLHSLTMTQRDLRMHQMNGTLTQAHVSNLRALQQQVQNNNAIMNFARAQQDALGFLPEVNQKISQAIGVDFASLAKTNSC